MPPRARFARIVLAFAAILIALATGVAFPDADDSAKPVPEIYRAAVANYRSGKTEEAIDAVKRFDRPTLTEAAASLARKNDDLRGEPLGHLKNAAHAAIGTLRPADRVALLTFSR